jgi:dephospho-CoA kinase
MVTRLCQGRYGVSVLDADILGHRSYAKGTPCYRQLLKTFGEEIVGEDGQINRSVLPSLPPSRPPALPALPLTSSCPPPRRALGRIVFSSPQERNRLEGIVWPEIRRLMEEDLRALGEVGRREGAREGGREGGREGKSEGR